MTINVKMIGVGLAAVVTAATIAVTTVKMVRAKRTIEEVKEAQDEVLGVIKEKMEAA